MANIFKRRYQNLIGIVAKKSADPDASWVKKGNKSYFGYRGYAIADGEKGFIHHLKVLPAMNQRLTNCLPC